jgi:hypothetical protein
MAAAKPKHDHDKVPVPKRLMLLPIVDEISAEIDDQARPKRTPKKPKEGK